jgi:hypothetical protein
MKPPSRSQEARLTPEQQAAVARTLERALASPAFRNSKQCQKFLRYVVEHSGSGDDEMLKERTIGVEVFGREPDYETSDDPVVRIRAGEVRKRLAQFYQESAAPEEVRLEIPQGSYRVEPHWPCCEAPPSAPPSPAPAPAPAPPQRLRRVLLLALAGVALAALAVFRFYPARPQSALDRFWSPVLDNAKPVLLYCGQPVVYFLSPDVHDKFRATVPAERRKGSYVVRFDPNEVLHGRDVIAVTDQFVGIGNAHTAILLSRLFAPRGKAVEIRYANDLSFSDLRGSPSVLIGAFSNLWTLEMTGQLRFVFEQDDGVRRVRDRTDNRVWKLDRLAPDGKTPEDYAVVSRVFDSAAGQVVVAAAGITQYGTRAAGEFLTDPARIAEAVAQAPAGWERRNLQVLLRAAVYQGTPAPPKIVATHFW